MNSIPATSSSTTNGTIRKFGVIAFTALLFATAVLYQGLTAGEAAASIDDGWRRTKDGWEHISTWPAEVTQQMAAGEILTTPAQISPAADYFLILHPALLAIGICVAAGYSLRLPRASS